MRLLLVLMAHLYKMNFIVNGAYEFPKEIIGQAEIFEAQLEKYIALSCPQVAVLSAFPAFIHDYYGNEVTKSRLKTEE